ncbi:MAG: adenine deaminase [Candidatus Woesearchaeota archaeon]
MSVKEREGFIDAALSEKKPDLVLKNGFIVNVYTGEKSKGDIAISGKKIVGMYDSYEGKKNIDVTGKYVVPGLIEGHIHVESSMLSLEEFCRTVLPLGTTAIIADPHEIANVMGEKAIMEFLANAKKIPMDIFITLPSCVPSTDMETSGSELTAEQINRLANIDRVCCLGEVMNYPGVLNKDTELLKKIEYVRKQWKRVDGHCPLLSGKELSAYIAAGVGSDHESTTGKEALEKLRKGMYLMIREGSASKDMKAIIPYLTSSGVSLHRCMFVSDDRHPGHLLEGGHIDHNIRKAISLGIEPAKAIRMASYNVAKHFGLRGHGSIGVGKMANLVVADDLHYFRVFMTIHRGKIVAKEGKIVVKIPDGKYSKEALNSVKLKKTFKASDFRIKGRSAKARVIGAGESLITKKLEMKAPFKDGELKIDASKDILKIAVIERHKGKNNFSVGLVNGFGLKQGAIASTVAHDSHNIVVVGANEDDMACAVNRLGKIQGGLVAVKNGKVVSELQLRLYGLMSTEPIGKVNENLKKLHTAAASFGCTLKSPFMTLSFMALPVIPELKITDKGLVENFSFVDVGM